MYDLTAKTTGYDIWGSVSYELNIQQIPLRVHVGGVAGYTSTEIKYDLDLYGTNYKQWVYLGSESETIKDSAFTYGFTVGAAYDLDNMYVTAGYEYLCYSGDLKDLKINNFTVGLGFRF